MYDFASKDWVYQVAAHTRSVTQVRFDPKGAALATVGSDKVVKTWDPSDDKGPAVRLKLTDEGPNTIDWTSDGEHTCGRVHRRYGADLRPHGQGAQKNGPRGWTGKSPIQVVRHARAAGRQEGRLRRRLPRGWAGVTDLETGAHPVLHKEHTNTVMAVNRSADGALAVSAGGDSNEIIVWKTADGTIVRKFQALNRGIWAVGWSKDGKSLAWGNTNGSGANGLHALEQTFLFNEFLTGDPPKPEEYGRHALEDGAFSIRVDGFFQFTVLEKGRPLYAYKTGTSRIYSVTLLPGKGIVVGASFAMYLLETKTGKLIRDYRGDRGLTTALAPSPDGRYFLSGSTDQVVRVWSPDHEEPLLSLFAAGREWLAWVPRGYYACSPYGERLIAWQVNDGIAKLPAVHPAVRFRASLYQPALIKYLIPAGDMRLAMAMAAKFDGERVGTAVLGDVLPPSVTITAPETATDKPVRVSGVAEGSEKNPVVAMRLLVDGRPYRGAAGVKKFDKQQKAEATWELALGPGVHSLAVQAESPVSKGMSARATCTREGEAETQPVRAGGRRVGLPRADAAALRGQRRASAHEDDQGEVARGVRRHRDEGTDGPRGHPGEHPRRAGLAEIEDDRQGRGHLLLLRPRRGRRAGARGLLPDPRGRGPNMAATCLAGDDLKSRLGDMPGRLVAILDACHAGEATDDQAGPGRITSSVT